MIPNVILTEVERESALTSPSEALISQMKGMAGTMMIVGAGARWAQLLQFWLPVLLQFQAPS